MDATVMIIAILALIGIAGTIWFGVKLAAVRKKYRGIIDIDAAVAERQNQVDASEKQIEELKADYRTKKEVYERLAHDVSVLEEDMEMISFGIYKPHYDFDTAEDFKNALTDVRARQKEMIKVKEAAKCTTQWTVEGSASKGRTMTNKYIRLMLRAFNGEADATIAKVRWDNITKMEARLEKAFEVINKTGEANHTFITQDYLDLKLEELRLTYEYQVKRHEEKEEQRRIKEEMREEERARKEYEKAQREAAAEKDRYERALAKAREEVEQASGEKQAKLREQMAKLEAQLAEALAKGERAKSMAELTKCGHVYVISNIGSFGEDVYKIGLTRRLEPLERVKELGDASVPFDFDVHALMYSENAPELEKELHKACEEHRINLVNLRREFFRVPLAEIEKIARKFNTEVKFTKLAEAKEYRESQAMRQAAAFAKQKEKAPAEPVFPDEL